MLSLTRRRSLPFVAMFGLIFAAMFVLAAMVGLRLHGDSSTPEELDRALKEVRAIQDEEDQLVGELRLAEEAESGEEDAALAQPPRELPEMHFDPPRADDPLASGIHLVTTYFRGTYSDARVNELLGALTHNLQNPHIRMVHVLWEDQDPSQHLADRGLAHKLTLTRVSRQPTYTEMFAYVNSHLKRGAVAIIANGDVYFDDSLKCVKPVAPDSPNFQLGKQRGKRPYFGLTRRHAPQCGAQADYKDIFDLCEHYIGSHDAFIFAPPVSQSLVELMNHTQNAGLGAENKVIWELNHSGEWRGFNPCDLIKVVHLHCTAERHYSGFDATHTKLVFVSGKGMNGGVRKHGWIKPWQ